LGEFADGRCACYFEHQDQAWSSSGRTRTNRVRTTVANINSGYKTCFFHKNGIRNKTFRSMGKGTLVPRAGNGARRMSSAPGTSPPGSA
ncbi:unnamed protein product, partial [Ectocarpus sp. 12 AP-2014]